MISSLSLTNSNSNKERSKPSTTFPNTMLNSTSFNKVFERLGSGSMINANSLHLRLGRLIKYERKLVIQKQHLLKEIVLWSNIVPNEESQKLLTEFGRMVHSTIETQEDILPKWEGIKLQLLNVNKREKKCNELKYKRNKLFKALETQQSKTGPSTHTTLTREALEELDVSTEIVEEQYIRSINNDFKSSIIDYLLVLQNSSHRLKESSNNFFEQLTFDNPNYYRKFLLGTGISSNSQSSTTTQNGLGYNRGIANNRLEYSSMSMPKFNIGELNAPGFVLNSRRATSRANNSGMSNNHVNQLSPISEHGLKDMSKHDHSSPNPDLQWSVPTPSKIGISSQRDKPLMIPGTHRDTNSDYVANENGRSRTGFNYNSDKSFLGEPYPSNDSGCPTCNKAHTHGSSRLTTPFHTDDLQISGTSYLRGSVHKKKPSEFEPDHSERDYESRNNNYIPNPPHRNNITFQTPGSFSTKLQMSNNDQWS